MDRGAWQATVHGVAKSQTPDTTEQFTHTHTHTHTHTRTLFRSFSFKTLSSPPTLSDDQFVKYLIVSCILSNAVSQSLIYNSKVQRAAKWEVYMAVKYKAT